MEYSFIKEKNKYRYKTLFENGEIEIVSEKQLEGRILDMVVAQILQRGQSEGTMNIIGICEISFTNSIKIWEKEDENTNRNT